jgi:UDP-N-acetylmuramoyl-L-alanyl-D-glutamate--2,6-diaminopimelate ligase
LSEGGDDGADVHILPLLLPKGKIWSILKGMKMFIQNLIPALALDWYYKFWPFLGALIYRFPTRKIKVIGITGTNGKTTVTHLLTDILEAAGYKVASVSSLRFKIGEKEWTNTLKMTMPGRMALQKFLRQAVDSSCSHAVIEVTSEGMKQHRHNFIDFDVAVLTNLTPEHIERHGGFERYKKTKGELFKIARNAVINVDDEHAEYFADLCRGKKYGYSVKSNNLGVTTSLPGEFNLSNALAAAYAGLSQGVDIETIKLALENFKGMPGRMEIVVKEPFRVIVDYAHNPDALEKMYKTIKESMDGRAGRMLCVLGAAGGGRDKWKRPVMGKIAAHYCDEIILTNEDPYDEEPGKIIEDIAKDIEGFKFLTKILDRRAAIKKALELAQPGDTVVVTGKGAEPWLMTKEGKIPWDDREIVRTTMQSILSRP